MEGDRMPREGVSAQWMVKVEEGIAELRRIAERQARRIEEIQAFQEAAQPAAVKRDLSPEVEARFSDGLITALDHACGMKIELPHGIPKDEWRKDDGFVVPAPTGRPPWNQKASTVIAPEVVEEVLRMVEKMRARPATVMVDAAYGARETMGEAVQGMTDHVAVKQFRMFGDQMPIVLHDRLIDRAKREGAGNMKLRILTAIQREMNNARCEDIPNPPVVFMEGMARVHAAVLRELGEGVNQWGIGPEEEGPGE